MPSEFSLKINSEFFKDLLNGLLVNLKIISTEEVLLQKSWLSATIVNYRTVFEIRVLKKLIHFPLILWRLEHSTLSLMNSKLSLYPCKYFNKQDCIIQVRICLCNGPLFVLFTWNSGKHYLTHLIVRKIYLRPHFLGALRGRQIGHDLMC